MRTSASNPLGQGPPPRVSEGTELDVNRAGFAIRLAAALVDVALLLPMFHALRLLAERMLDKSGVWASVFAGNGLVLAYTSLEVFRGTTPGKALLRLSIRDESGAPAPRQRLLARWAIKYGARICGLVDAVTGIIVVRRAAEWLGLAVFRQEPINFVTLRYVGELLLLFATIAFFFTLGPSRLALYDRITRTAVYRRPNVVAKRGFDPLPVLPAETATPDPPAAGN